jgi:hypothetical protein
MKKLYDIQSNAMDTSCESKKRGLSCVAACSISLHRRMNSDDDAYVLI